MKVAVVHDYLTVYAGAERVTREILDLYPDADVYTLIDTMVGHREFLAGHTIRRSWIDRLPGIARYYRNLFPLYPWAIRHFDLSQYDLIISSSHSAAKGVKVRPGQMHVCYCHSPARWAWDLKQQYLQEAGLDRGLKGRLASFLIERFRRWDAKNTEGVNHFIANSSYIADRIRRTYGRDAMVVHPPVDTDAFTLQTEKDDYYVVVSRLVWYKKVGIAVEAFNRMPNRRLVVVGGGPQLQEIQELAGPNVDVRGHVSDEELRDLVGRARGFVFPAEEDFGISPVEAQASGTPVLAFAKGGALETVIDGTTGLFFDSQDPQAIIDAVVRFESTAFDAAMIRSHAQRFATERFRNRFRATLDSLLAHGRLTLGSTEGRGP